jgi:hypothetical protein
MDSIYNIGPRLISSRDPDFVADMIRESSGKSLTWLRDVLVRDERVADVLPPLSLAQLLAEMHSARSEVVEKLVKVLSAAFADEAQRAAVLEFFFSQLASPYVLP